MRQTESHIGWRIAGLMSPVAGLLRSARVLTVAALTALALSSCGSGGSDDPGTPGTTPGSGPGTPDPTTETPVVFTALQQEAQDVTRGSHETAAGTRASIPLEDQGATSFKVWGYKNKSYNTDDGYLDPQIVFPGYIVNYSANTANTTLSNSSNWEYVGQQPNSSPDEQTIKYWDWSVAAYRFFGITHVGQVKTVAETSEYLQFSFTVNTKNIERCPFYSHLWLSNGNTAQGQKPFGKPVQLEFLRSFATVRYVLVPADSNVDLADLNIVSSVFKPFTIGGQIYVNGEFEVTYPLKGTASGETWKTTPGSKIDDKITSFTSPETDYAVLPVRDQGAFELSLYVNGDERFTYVPGEYMDWLPGFEYTYVFKVNKEGGVALGEVISAYRKWEENEGQNVDRTIYNW